MTSRLLMCAVLIALSSSAVASDRPPQYFGLSVAANELSFEHEGNRFTSDLTNLGLRGGYRFNNFFALEGHVGYGRANGRDFGEKPELILGGGFARFDLPFEQVSLYGLAGISTISVDIGGSTEMETGGSLGLGVELYGNPTTAINLEYIAHVDQDYEGFGIGFIHHFNWPALRR